MTKKRNTADVAPASPNKAETPNKCTECTNNLISDFTNLQIKCDSLKKHVEILNNCIDVKEELCAFYRKENESLRRELEIYENDNRN